jgi:hypothetical protein
VLNQVNIQYLLVHVFFMLSLSKALQYGMIYLLATHVDHLVPLTPSLYSKIYINEYISTFHIESAYTLNKGC